MDIRPGGRAVRAWLLPGVCLLPTGARDGGERMAVRADFQVDHVFVAVPSSRSAAEALRDAGFVEGPSRAHPGQGTASRGVFFENTYVELIWLVDAEEAGSEVIRRTHLLERTGRQPGACPFGISLRRSGDPSARLPFSTWDYRPPYVPEGTAIPVGTNSADPTEPLLFLLPWRSEPGWPPPEHPNGSRRVTRVSVMLPDDDGASPHLEYLRESGLVELARGAGYLMVVELDGARRGDTLDLRPDVPLILTW